MKILIKCVGFIGDHLFASGLAKELSIKHNSQDVKLYVDYSVGVHQVFNLFNNNPYISRVLHESQLTDELEKEYDIVYTLPEVDQSIPPPLYFRQYCGIETNNTDYDIHTNIGSDTSCEIQFPTDKKIIAWPGDWRERSFLYTEEEYKAGINKAPLGYGGKRRDIKHIIDMLNEDFHMLRVGFPGELPNDKINPLGGVTAAATYGGTASVIKMCDYMIGSEGGLTNLAAAVGTKTIITGDFVHQLYGWNGCIKKIKEPKLGPEFYYPNAGHVSLDPFATDNEVIEQIKSIVND